VKACLSFAACVTAVSGLAADLVPPVGAPYHPPDIEIAWNAPTNDLPADLWVYRVIPQTLSPAVISNAMAVGSFMTADAIKSPFPIPIQDTHLLCFRTSRGGSRSLYIAPSLGWMKYEKATDYKELGKEVPSDEAVGNLAMNVLFQLGADRSQVVERKSRWAASHGDTDSTGTKLTETIYSRGATLDRRVDGIPMPGEGLLVNFGNYAEVKSFNFSWRNLQPYEAHRVATPQQIGQWIKQGRAFWLASGSEREDFSQARKLTTTKITLFYRGNNEMEPQRLVYPYARLEVTADLGKTNATLYLQCPIISDADGDKPSQNQQ
jgi:hypothetical protein